MNTNTNTNTNNNININDNDNIFSDASDLISKSISDAGDVITKSSNDLIENTANILSPGSEIKDTIPNMDSANESLFTADTKTTTLNSGNFLEMVVNYLRENGIYILLIVFTFLFLISIFSILGINTEKENRKKNDAKQKEGDGNGDDDVDDGKDNKYSKVVTVEGFKPNVDYKYYINKEI